MADLHYLSTPRTCPNSLAWDCLQNIGVFSTDMSLVMDDHDGYGYSAPFFSSSSSSPLESSDLSTGYLEDVLVEFGSKRRRLLLCDDDHRQDYHYESTDDHLMESYWNSNCTWGLPENFSSCMSQISSFNGVSSDEFGSTSSGSEEANVLAEVKTPEEAISGFDEDIDDDVLGSSSYKVSAKSDKSQNILSFPTGPEDDVDEIGKRKTRVVYPFALVKPGGIEGDVTLSDINRRILMRPTRPVRHPVGDFACRPRLFPEGPGISGKAVVALTRIQTHGKGTITIIRTKG